MDYESERTRNLGCWDGPSLLTPDIDAWTATADSSFEPSTKYCDFLIDIGFGKECPSETRDFWRKEIKANYQGDEGRKRIRMAAVNLRERDGLHGRLNYIKCPTLWLHGTSDAVYTVKNAEEEIKLFTGSPDARVKVVEDGQHFLSFSHPQEVDEALIEFVGKYGK